MHILMGLVSFLTVVGGIIFWLRIVSRATKGAIELSDDVRAAFRRFGFTAKSQTDPLDAVDDSRIAAVGIFMALARMDGELSREQIAGIRSESARLFNTTDREAEDLIVIGKWLVQERRSEESVRRLTRHLVGRLTANEARAFISSAENVAAMEGAIADEQRETIEALRRELR